MQKVLLYFLIFILLMPHMAFAQYHQWTKLKGGYLMAVSKEAYDRAWDFINANDNEAINKMFILGTIKKTVEGTEVYVEETHVFHGSREVRLKGSVQIYWVSEMALYQPKETQSQKDNEQINASAKNISKLDGVMIDNGEVVIFVSTGGRVSTLKIGDHLCGGKVLQTYLPGEEDGITSKQSTSRYQYRIKMKVNEEEKIFKNGDVICEEAM